MSFLTDDKKKILDQFVLFVKEQLELKMAEELVGELIGRENSPAVGQLYRMGAIENQTRGRGIGSY